MRRDVDRTAGVDVVVPRASDLLGALEDQKVPGPLSAEGDARADPADPGAEDQDLNVPRLL